MNWVQQQPGTLVLEGTVMSVVYKPSSKGDFHIFQGERRKYSCATLAFAKSEAEHLYQQLVEIGAQ